MAAFTFFEGPTGLIPEPVSIPLLSFTLSDLTFLPDDDGAIIPPIGWIQFKDVEIPRRLTS